MSQNIMDDVTRKGEGDLVTGKRALDFFSQTENIPVNFSSRLSF